MKITAKLYLLIFVDDNYYGDSSIKRLQTTSFTVDSWEIIEQAIKQNTGSFGDPYRIDGHLLQYPTVIFSIVQVILDIAS